MDLLKRLLRPGTVIRIVADAILLQIALICALALRFYFLLAFRNLQEESYAQALHMYQRWYLQTSIPLTSLCLIVFCASGFYTRGPYYQNRYKVLVVIQAVTTSFVAYAFAILFFTGELSFARFALVAAWLFSILLLAGARVWNAI